MSVENEHGEIYTRKASKTVLFYCEHELMRHIGYTFLEGIQAGQTNFNPL